MSGKIKAAAFRYAIIVIFTVLIAFAISFYYSEKAFAEEPLSLASVEDEAEDTEQGILCDQRSK